MLISIHDFNLLHCPLKDQCGINTILGGLEAPVLRDRLRLVDDGTVELGWREIHTRDSALSSPSATVSAHPIPFVAIASCIPEARDGEEAKFVRCSTVAPEINVSLARCIRSKASQ